MALINIEKDNTTYSVNTQNVTSIVKFTNDPTTYQVFVDGYYNAFIITEDKYQEFLNADYSGGGGGQGGIQSNTISRMEYDGENLNINGNRANIPTSESISTIDYADNSLIIDGEEVEVGGSNMVYNTATGVLSGAKNQDGDDVNLTVGTITITF